MPTDRPAAVTRALQHPDRPGAGAALRRRLSAPHKFRAVLAEGARGTLRMGRTGKPVPKGRRDIQLAIAFSEARKESPGFGGGPREALKRRRARGR